jgi:hypothetical protein
MIFSRRAGLKLMAASPLILVPTRLFPAKSFAFWNKENPSEWSKAEIQQLTTDSPWAKPVTAEVKSYSPQSSGAGERRGGGGRRGWTSASSNPSANSPKFPGIVTWVSAKPILLALKVQLPSDFVQHYVIGVSGLPVVSGHGEGSGSADAYAPLKETTYLQVRGQDAAQPGIIRQDPNDTSSVLFGFLNQFLDLSQAKSVTFATTMGLLSVKVKFDLARMTYKGELAV